MKPGDFLLGVLEFFAVLLPGAMGMWLAAQYAPPTLAAAMLPTKEANAIQTFVYFLGAFTLGHFIFMAGSYLDFLYDDWRQRTKPTETDHTFQAAKRLHKSISPSLAQGSLTTLRWSRSYIQVHAAEARAEIDQLEANSKFFRSIVALSIAFTLHFALREGAIDMACLSVVLGILSFERFCDQRWKMTELSYSTVVILYETKLKPPKPAESHEHFLPPPF